MGVQGRLAIVMAVLSSLAAAAGVARGASGGLEDLARVRDAESRRASSWDRTGGNLDCLVDFRPGATHRIDLDGPGRITHLWMTGSAFPGHATFLRDLVLRIYWDGSDVPSVEVPVGDFFGLGHGRAYAYASLPVAVGGNDHALNCYWPMPFRRQARVELYNNGDRTIRSIYYHVDYERGEQPADQAYFHAAYRREKALRTQDGSANLSGKDNYVILDAAGRGQYVGCFLFVDAQPGGWWGEGDDMIFVDGSETPTINGTGSEDYFNNAWGYDRPFSYPYYGCPLLEKRPDGGTLTAVYRWHVVDPIRFKTHVRVTIEHLFDRKAANDYSSVAFWYQDRPAAGRDPLPRGGDNHPAIHPATRPATAAPVAKVEVNATELEASLLARGVRAEAHRATAAGRVVPGGWLRVDTAGREVEVPVPAPSGPGTYGVAVRTVDVGGGSDGAGGGSVRVGLKGGAPKVVDRAGAWTDIGDAATADGVVTLVVKGEPAVVGLHRILLTRR
jgi:hypothetical protein